jgi:hypothetical protein
MGESLYRLCNRRSWSMGRRVAKSVCLSMPEAKYLCGWVFIHMVARSFGLRKSEVKTIETSYVDTRTHTFAYRKSMVFELEIS